jgi:uncharacterized protein Yka (UPF0111/DUF47 family)
MQKEQMRETADRIEQCADEALQALQRAGGGAPDELRDCVKQMHQEARELRDVARQAGDEEQIAGRVARLEQTGDRAKQACRTAGSRIDPQLQSAVMRAHDEISSFKKQMQ